MRLVQCARQSTQKRRITRHRTVMLEWATFEKRVYVCSLQFSIILIYIFAKFIIVSGNIHTKNSAQGRFPHMPFGCFFFIVCNLTVFFCVLLLIFVELFVFTVIHFMTLNCGMKNFLWFLKPFEDVAHTSRMTHIGVSFQKRLRLLTSKVNTRGMY